MTPLQFHRRWAFVDASAYYALADRDDNNHSSAVSVHRRLTTERWRAYTSNFIVAEAHALILNRLGRRLAARFLADVDGSSTTIARVSEEDEQRARAILTQYDDKDFSLTDATSFAVMERLGISFAFTFDSDFAAFGRFTILQP